MHKVKISSELDRYLSALRAEGRSENTISTYQGQIDRFLRWLKENAGAADPLQITSIDAAEYRDYLQNEKDLKPASVAIALDSIYAFCKWMVDEGYRDHNPLQNVKRPEQDKTVPKWLTKNERFRVIQTALNEKQRRNTAIVMTLLMAGLRVSELTNLKLADVIIGQSKGTITVRGNARTRTIPIPRALRDCLAEYMVEERASAEWLFASQRGEQLKEDGVRNLCSSIGEKAKVDGLTPHVLRHTFCHDLIDQGVNVFVAAKLAGHSRVETMVFYAYPGEDELQAVEKLNFTSTLKEMEQLRGGESNAQD